MAVKTNIEWCDSTVNPAPCCTGCELYLDHCYAAAMTKRFAGRNPGYPKSFTTPTLFSDRIIDAAHWPDLAGTKRPKKPWLDSRPRMIFLNDMGDPFAPFKETLWTPKFHWLQTVLPVIEKSPHIWMLLTKWPDRFAEFAASHAPPLPHNLWGGTSVTSPDNEWRIGELLKIDLAVRFLSLEPLLERSGGKLYEYLDPVMTGSNDPSLDWVSVGPETGPGARDCDPEWIRSVIDQCAAAGVPAFVKAFPILGKVSKDMAEWPRWARVRELPEGKRWVK